MRKISKSIANAFKNGERRSIGNTVTDNDEVLLHGNRIMWKNDSGDLCLSMCGWATRTTRERLNALLEVLGSRFRIVHSFSTSSTTYAVDESRRDVEVDSDQAIHIHRPIKPSEFYRIARLGTSTEVWREIYNRGD